MTTATDVHRSPRPGSPPRISGRLFRTAGVLALLLAAVPPAGAADAPTVAELETRLKQAVVGGYTNRSVTQALSIFTDDARIVGRIIGVAGVAQVREFLERDFSGCSAVEAEIVELELLGYADEVATIRYRLRARLVGPPLPVVRDEIYFMKLRRVDGTWKAFLQGYRPDFGHTPFSHDAGGSHPMPLAEPPTAPAPEKPQGI